MKLSEYLEVRGRQAKLSRDLKVSPVLIHQWATIRTVPIERCVSIEVATNGEVTRQDLRPDDWHLIWPELMDDKRSPNKGRPRTPTRRKGDEALIEAIKGRRKRLDIQ